MRKLFVFDWDGTIVDSVHQIIACKQWLAEKYHLPIPNAELIKSVLGMEFHSALQSCFPTTESDLLHQYGHEFQASMQTERFHASLFPGVKKLLTFLKNRDIKLAVATSKSRQELNHSLEKTGLKNFFDLTCCSEEYLPKPNPKMLEYILSTLGIAEKDCIYIGDAVVDITFARNANVDVASVLFGAGSRDDIKRHSPKFMIESWESFLKTVQGHAI